eukprot:1196137-Prorocentrum_minimum.AAC.1
MTESSAEFRDNAHLWLLLPRMSDGLQIAYGSYNAKDADVVRGTLVVGCCNSACSIFAVCALFI